ALLVVHPDGGRDVHGRDEAEPLLDRGRIDNPRHAIGDVDELVPLAGLEPEILGVCAHTSALTRRRRARKSLRYQPMPSRRRIPPASSPRAAQMFSKLYGQRR